ncbi:MAG: DUF3054 domain-containing protein [Nocardioides sp.]|uniref:DUF3054 domain-containing protein n=1 Tax=Nocardioides sp. TaxID=35761 RepID=UPI0039E5D591
MSSPTPRRTVATLAPVHAGLCFAGDVVCVLLFALGGHQSHEASSSQLVTLRIAWPFLVACALAWLMLVWRSWDARRIVPAGVTVWLTTFVVGMALRLVSGRGVELAFLIVSLVFLGLTMIGWRCAAGLRRR